MENVLRLFILLPFFLKLTVAKEPEKVPVLQEIDAAIKKHNPKTLDELFKHLPKTPFRAYSLMEQTNSRQEASASFPRAIAFGEDASAILAFNGHSSQARHGELEIAHLLPDGALELRLITQSIDKAVTISEANPSACLKCHGNPPRWIWGRYQNWPGAVGNTRSAVDGEPFDAKGFKIAAQQHPRYSLLEGISDKDSYLLGGVYNPYSPMNENSLTQLGTYIIRHFVNIQANRIKSSKLSPQTQYFLAAILYGCEPTKELREKIIYELNSDRAILKLNADDRSVILAILKQAGVSLEDIRYRADKQPKDAEVSVLDYFDGRSPARNYLTFALLKNLAVKSPSLNKWLPTAETNSDKAADRYFNAPDRISLAMPSIVKGAEKAKAICTILENNSKELPPQEKQPEKPAHR